MGEGWVGSADDEVAAAIEMPMPEERGKVLRSESGLLLARLLAKRSRQRGALDIAIGDSLARMSIGSRGMTFWYAGIGDYARERLGINARTAQKMARLARALWERPLLREAVWMGEITARKAETILPVARGSEEELWLRLARTDTVRALAAKVKKAIGREPLEEEEPWEALGVPLQASAKPAVDKAMEFARMSVGSTAPLWERLDAFFMEFLSRYGEADEGGRANVLRWRLEREQEYLGKVEEMLERETRQWAHLDPVQPVVAPPVQEETDPVRIDAELKRLVGERNASDEEFGRLALVFRNLGLWRDAGFGSFRQFCFEWLGMSVRAVEQRIALERRLAALPELRQAMREGRISYEKARLIAWKADDATVKEWIEKAAGTTCIGLRREIEAKEEAQMWAAEVHEVRVPRHTVELFEAVCRAARNTAKENLTPGDCFLWAVLHFIEVWEPILKLPNTLRNRVLKRDRGLCQVPGCSRAGGHTHHVCFRCHGGPNTEWNELSICAAHHLCGIHEGFIVVSGRAPDQLVWENGPRGRRESLIA